MGYEVFQRPVKAQNITAIGVPGFTGDGSGLTGIASASLDPTLLQKAVVTLTSAQLKAMFGTPVSILAAPGAGIAILVDQILVEFIYPASGGTAYTGGGAVSFVYHGGSIATHSGSVQASVFTAAASANILLGGAVPANGTVISANVGIDITNASGAFLTGNGTAKITIWYSAVPL